MIWKRILIVVAVVIVGIQFIPRNHDSIIINPVEAFDADNAPSELALLKAACYDCHSNETEYPWYANVQPLALWLDHHVDEGREELNFSIWNTYTFKEMDHKLEESIEMVEKKEMPLSSFTWTHPEARLSDEERLQLTTWFQKLRAEL